MRRVLGDIKRVDVRDVLGAPLRLPLGQLEVGRVVAQEGRVVELGDLRHRVTRRALPIVRVAQVLDVVLRAARHQVRARPDRRRVGERVELGLVLLGPEVLRHDRNLVRDVVEVGLGGPREREDDLVGPLQHHVRQRAAVRLPEGVGIERRVSLECVERVEDVGGAERLAVAPRDAAADREGQRRVVGVPCGPCREPRGHDVRTVGIRLERVDELERFVDEAHRRPG